MMTDNNIAERKLGEAPAKAENAILVIDMQNDFVRPDGPLFVAGAPATIPAIREFLDFGRSHGWAIIYVCRSHHQSGIDAEPFRRHFFEEGRPFCVEGTAGARIADGIDPQPGDILLAKTRFSAFFGTRLDIILRGLATKNVYITGTQYPNCVRATAVDAMSLGYNTIIVTDCCSAASEDVATANIRDLSNMGILCLPSRNIR